MCQQIQAIPPLATVTPPMLFTNGDFFQSDSDLVDYRLFVVGPQGNYKYNCKSDNSCGDIEFPLPAGC